MPLSKAHKAQTRERIVDAAARLFRARGYDGVSVDAIMSEAGLTRGGFYAHFASKAALLQEVLATRHDLIRRLSERGAAAAGDLRRAGAGIFVAYLNPGNLDKVGPNCTLSTLNLDAARTSPEAQRIYTDALARLLEQIERGATDAGGAGFDETTLNIASMAVGALSLARTCDDRRLQSAILDAARAQISRWFGA